MIFHIDQLSFLVFQLKEKENTKLAKQFEKNGIAKHQIVRVNRMFREHMRVFQNTNNPKDPGLLRIKEAERRIKRLTLDDVYRIIQMEYTLFFGSSPAIEPGKADNYVWRMGREGRELTEHEHDLVFLMLSRNGWLKPSKLLNGIDNRVKGLKGNISLAQKFGKPVPDDK